VRWMLDARSRFRVWVAQLLRGLGIHRVNTTMTYKLGLNRGGVKKILLKKFHSKNQGKIFRSQKLTNTRSELG